MAGSVLGRSSIASASAAAEPASDGARRSRSARVEPGHGSSLADLAERDADGDPCQPGTERALAAPARERSIGGHEGLLGGILGLVEVTEDPVTGPHHRRRLAVDEVAVGIPIAGEDGIDDRAVIAFVVRAWWSCRGWADSGRPGRCPDGTPKPGSPPS